MPTTAPTTPTEAPSAQPSEEPTDGGTTGGGTTGGTDNTTPPPPSIGEDGSVTITPPSPGETPDNVSVDGSDLSPDDFTIDENGNLVLTPEFIASLPDGTHVISVSYGGNTYESTLITENGVPLSAGNFKAVGGSWSLFDLLSTIFVALAAIYVIFFKKRKKQDQEAIKDDLFNQKYEELEDEKFAKLRVGKSIALIIEAAMAVILLLITQDFTQPMVIFDQYSIAFGLSVALSILIVMIANKKRKDGEEDRGLTVDQKINGYTEELENDKKKMFFGKLFAIIVDVALIAVLIYVVRGLSSWFVFDLFTVVFILCAVLAVMILLISNKTQDTIQDRIEGNANKTRRTNR